MNNIKKTNCPIELESIKKHQIIELFKNVEKLACEIWTWTEIVIIQKEKMTILETKILKQQKEINKLTKFIAEKPLKVS